ncbi:MAG: class I SAM-dependent methyltransferase [Caulobacteraceae bacterium]
MTTHPYDEHAQFYLDFVDRGLAAKNGYTQLVASSLSRCLGERLSGARVCDLCCGEGYLGRFLIRQGAREVVGVDLSPKLISEARRRADAPGLAYCVDDAQTLRSMPDGTFDVVISQMAMMDVADDRRLFLAVRRVLAAGGPFVFSLLHPCFQGPIHVSDCPPFVLQEEDRAVALAVRRYASEGYWNSGGDGVRGHMGSHHRMISTYVNNLIEAGFAIERMEEILAGGDPSGVGIFAELPTVLVIAARSA